ncbi:MAG: hypothetical protein OZ921_17285 [Sorangiineae bacterium]|nr:hypothetical protein [Polyangiaceae bacterium]MEB2324271.1 hypothetical protein [Sorangiineae bacterium]
MSASLLRAAGRRAKLAAALGLGAALGCSSAGSLDAADGAGAAGAAASDSGAPAVPDALVFEPSRTITLLPNEHRELSVRATPRGAYLVRFALLGGFADASLDAGEALTNADGAASVRLVAPGGPAAFTVRASVGAGVTAELPVSVSASGFASLDVRPSYAGKRAVSMWVASVHAGTSCAALTGTPPPDGALVAQSLVTSAPRIDSVPIGPLLAVTVRAGHFAGGCADLKSVLADELNVVSVPVIDRPLQLGGTDLDVALGLDGDGWRKPLATRAGPTADALLGGAPDDLAALLDAMSGSLTPDQARAFDDARSAGGWDALLSAALGGPTPPTLLRDRLTAWMTAGVAALGSGAAFEGHLFGAAPSAGSAELELERVGGIAASEAGFATRYLVSWTGDTGDTVALGAQLAWLPSRLLTALAVAPALADSPGAQSVPEALERAVGCSAVADTLTAHGALEPLPGLDAERAAALCRAGLGVLWQRVRDATGDDWTTGKLEVSAAGVARVDDEAGPASFSGSWIGKLGLATSTVPVGGAATGASAHPR